MDFAQFVKSENINATNALSKFARKSEFFKLIQNSLTQSDDSCTMLSKDFWPQFFSDFQNHHMNQDQLNQFLDYLEKFVQFNFQGECKVGEKQMTIEDFGQKFHQLENHLHFKRQRAMKYLMFISERKNESNLKQQFVFWDLKFDLSEEEALKLAVKVRTFFQEDMDAFAFLSLYLQKSVTQALDKKIWQQVEKKYTNVLKLLQEKYPANKSEVSADKTNGKQTANNKTPSNSEEKWKILKDEEKYEVVKFEKGKSEYETLEQFIIEKSKEAKTKKDEFDKLVKYICYEKGYGFKNGVKIKSPQSKDSIFRTIEKLVEDEMKDLPSSNENQERKKKVVTRQQVKSILAEEKHKTVENIKSLLGQKSEISFKAKDLLRGKSTFENVEYILEARQKIKKKVEESNRKYQIIEEKNKLFGKTKDLVLIIKIEKVIAEFQLVLQLDSASNEFNHKIYELQRSKVYSMIPNLFVHNKKWSEEFFSDQLDLIDHLIDQSQQQKREKTKSQKQIIPCQSKKERDKFKDLLRDSDSLKEQNPEEIDQTKVLNQKIIKILNQNRSHKQSKEECNKKTKESQKLNQSKYFTEANNFQKSEELLKDLKSNDEKTQAQILFQKGQTKRLKGLHIQALENYEKCLEIQIQIFGPDSKDVALTLNKIGTVYWNKGMREQALEKYQKCLEIRTKIFGLDSKDVAGTLNNIGNVYSNKNMHKQALENYQKCLEIRTKIFGPDSKDVAATLNNIGLVYSNKGMHKKALENYEKCLEIKSKIFGPDSKDVAAILNNIGLVYSNKGMHKQALENYEKCLEIKSKIFGPYSKDVTVALNNIGIVYWNKGKREQALENFEKCLEIQIQIFGRDSKDVALTLNNIGNVYKNKGMYNQALEIYEKCLEIKSKIFGPDSKDVADTLNNIGNLYSKRDMHNQALEYYERCLGIQAKIFGPDSKEIIGTLNNIGNVYDDKGMHKQALEYYERCLEIQTKIFGPDSKDVAATLNNIGCVYRNQNMYNEALEYYERCLEIQTKIFGPNSKDVATTLNSIGCVYRSKGMDKQALESFQKCFQIRIKFF